MMTRKDYVAFANALGDTAFRASSRNIALIVG